MPDDSFKKLPKFGKISGLSTLVPVTLNFMNKKKMITKLVEFWVIYNFKYFNVLLCNLLL